MLLKFDTSTFRYDSEQEGYIGNPGLISDGQNEINCSVWLDIDGIKAQGADNSIYDFAVSYHGPIVVHIDTDDANKLKGSTDIEIGGVRYELGVTIKGAYSEDDNGYYTGKIVIIQFYCVLR